MGNVTVLIEKLEQGDGRAVDELLPLVYEELRCLAAARLAREEPGQTLQPTALVHEAWLRLVGQGNPELRPEWNGRAHFFGAAAEAMRRILVERARKKARIRHGGAQQRVDFESATIAVEDPDETVLELNDALERLAREFPREAEVVKLRYFAGMEHAETARVLGVAEITVRRHWKFARAWLHKELSRA
ncbi:MAG: sigma-70 family RNA polymerase sigma factor [Verrucomicrobiales bacterium]|nr:sigma-70 family RNA polymerase sigma factor [Verrucomicrobiales bacterium]